MENDIDHRTKWKSRKGLDQHTANQRQQGLNL